MGDTEGSYLTEKNSKTAKQLVRLQIQLSMTQA